MEKKIVLVIEKGNGGYWGRVNYDDNLIAEFAPGVLELTEAMRQLVVDFHGEDPQKIDFEYQYDMTALFEAYPELNISKVAERAGINPGLVRQYKSAVKHPSEAQARKIEEAIHSLAHDLLKMHLV
jgi:methionine synthase II (cobalamin-independent)